MEFFFSVALRLQERKVYFFLIIFRIVVLYIKVLKRDIPWEHYMSTKLISGTCLQLLRRYDHKPESQRAPLLDEVSCFLTLNYLFEIKLQYITALFFHLSDLVLSCYDR